MDAERDWTNATRAPGHMLGHVLRPEQFLARARYDRAAPDPRLARWIDRYWSVHWDLAPGESHQVTTLDEPAVHLTVEAGDVRREGTQGAGTWITGPVTRGSFRITQRGRGGVVGVRFRLGGTTAFVDADLSALRDRTIPATDWFPDPPRPAALAGASATEAAGLLDRWLLAQEPREVPGLTDLEHLLDLLADPAVTGTGLLEERSGLSTRSLQRTFRRFVGVGPKRMLLRARVMDAVAALDGGDPRPVADLAQDLGWFDQSHFLRDFRAITGASPGHYLRRDAR
ncbi:DUF6597 domain-containing transcriptional factor [Brachybacterium sp. UNK5269]|uniref:AraC family transcriptional regulator n=1 Tax=Brachybacterium sp. UNK5269 TaxID=3408576 RepID=UPI003BAF8F5C